MIEILMIEDDTELAQILTQYLKKYNINVTNYEDPYFGLSALRLSTYSLVILDLTLPGLDGLEVCKKILNDFDIPIIISSARSDITDKVTALELGADDYLPKPYDPRELEVRIKTILRRYSNTTSSETTSQEIKDKTFIYDEEKKTIFKNNIPLKLTALEFELLSLFIKRENFVISKEDIYDYMDGLYGVGDNNGSLAVMINRIRHKIEDDVKNPKYLHTIRGMGYKFVQ